MQYDRNQVKHTFEELYAHSILGFSNNYPIAECYENNEKRIFSRDEYIAKIEAIAAALEKELSGIEKGRWIALRHRTHVYWLPVFLALEMIGYKVMSVDENIAGNGLARVMEMGNLAAVISHAPLGMEGLRDISFDAVTAAETGKPEKVCWETQMCVCTSGTSSAAKTIVFNAEIILQIQKNIKNFTFASPEVVDSLRAIPPHETRILVTLPMRHIFGFEIPMIFWGQGCTMVFPKNNGVLELTEAIKRERIWFTYGVPALWKAIFRIYQNKCGTVSPETFREFFGEQFTHGMIGGARIDADFKNLVNSTGFCLSNAYGGTEIGGCVSIGYFNTEPDMGIPGEYSGAAMNGHIPKIIQEDGSIVDEGTGELAVLGNKCIYSGILEHGAFVSRIERFGEMYRTGDMFTIKDGILFYQGRCSNMIVNDSGENIYPEELEEDFSVLETMTNQFCFIGIDDEPVLLLHTADSYENFEESALFAAIQKRNGELPHYKRLASVIVFRDPLPKTLKGEVSKKDMLNEIESRSKLEDAMREITMKGKRKA